MQSLKESIEEFTAERQDTNFTQMSIGENLRFEMLLVNFTDSDSISGNYSTLWHHLGSPQCVTVG